MAMALNIFSFLVASVLFLYVAHCTSDSDDFEVSDSDVYRYTSNDKGGRPLSCFFQQSTSCFVAR